MQLSLSMCPGICIQKRRRRTSRSTSWPPTANRQTGSPAPMRQTTYRPIGISKCRSSEVETIGYKRICTNYFFKLFREAKLERFTIKIYILQEI